MSLKELYNNLRDKLKNMYENSKGSVTLDVHEFFAVYKAVCDLMQIKRITDGQ